MAEQINVNLVLQMIKIIILRQRKRKKMLEYHQLL